ncbi:MFS transporter [Mucisphaera calidilacus]|uniref:Major Facilitator Superfamily protein n=1 Tax=Mucisphaera calidilacus TaxID=2527982 RepID=A0A518BTD7_9BACT|nr:MFS transporter [Mucisphaera calidilacus]QDU70242.1 Major Facilitator Superfamily protein [Mucisphaera calidilacus]
MSFTDTVNTLQPRTRAAELNRQLWWILVAWIFGAWWLWTMQGAAVEIFKKQLNTPTWAFGLFGAMVFVGPLAQLPGSLFIEKFGHRRAFFFVVLIAGRLAWVLIGLIPWLLPGLDAWWWVIFLLLFGVSRLLNDSGGPPWLNWMSDVIPRRIRGTYFAERNRWGLAASLAATTFAGVVLYLADNALWATTFLLILAGIMGTIDILCFLVVPDPGPKHPRRNPAPLRSLLVPLLDREFRPFLGYGFFFAMSASMMGAYGFHYAIFVLEWDSFSLNVFLLAIPFAFKFLITPVWGAVVDKVGKRPVLIMGQLLLLPVPVNWLLMSHDSIWPGYFLVLVANLGWAAIEISSFNIILDLSGSARKPHHQRAGSAYPAINAVVSATGGILGGLIGLVYAINFEGFHYSFTVSSVLNDVDTNVESTLFESQLTFHALIFALAILLRITALLFSIQLHEPRSQGTREAMAFTTSAFYSNIRGGLLAPTRMAGRILEASYRLRR